MKKLDNQLRFRLATGVLIALSALLLPGAIEGSGAENISKDQMAVEDALSSLSSIAPEIPENRRDGFAKLAGSDPLFMLKINAQHFDAARHGALWQ